MPHVSIAGHHPTEGHATVLPAVRDVRIPVLCCLYQVRFPSRHWETCSHQGKDCVTMEKLVCDYKYSNQSGNFDHAVNNIHVTIDTVCFSYMYNNMDTLPCFSHLLQSRKLSNAIHYLVVIPCFGKLIVTLIIMAQLKPHYQLYIKEIKFKTINTNPNMSMFDVHSKLSYYKSRLCSSFFQEEDHCSLIWDWSLPLLLRPWISVLLYWVLPITSKYFQRKLKNDYLSRLFRA